MAAADVRAYILAHLLSELDSDVYELYGGAISDQMAVNRSPGKVLIGVIPAQDIMPPDQQYLDRRILIQVRPTITERQVSTPVDMITGDAIENRVQEITDALSTIESAADAPYWFIAPSEVRYQRGIWADLFILVKADTVWQSAGTNPGA